MYQVIVRKGRKTIEKQVFSDEQEAWDFYDLYCDEYACEIRNLLVLRPL